MFKKSSHMIATDNISVNDRVNMLSESDFEEIFPYTYHYLMNLCENNWIYLSQFINWLATHLHTREKISTSWVFKSSQGAGKDTLREVILEKLYGKSQVKAITKNAVLSNFNKVLMDAMCVVLNEAATDPQEANKISSVIKNWITDKTLQIEPKGVDSFNVETFFSFIVFSNELVPVPIEVSDRRFNVMQAEKSMIRVAHEDLKITIEEFREHVIEESELFTKFISLLNYNESVARQCINNETKRAIVHSSQTRKALFKDLLSNRTRENLKMFYNDMIETIHAKALEAEYAKEGYNLEAEEYRLKEFMKYVIKGKVASKEMTHYLRLFLNDKTPISITMASRVITQMFGSSVPYKVEGNTIRLTKLGKKLDPLLLDEILFVEEDTIVSQEELAKIVNAEDLQDEEIEIEATEMEAAEIAGITFEDIVKNKILAKKTVA